MIIILDHLPLYLYILAAEVLTKTVRNNKSIRGFSLGNDEVSKISQFADETTLNLDGPEKSLTSAIQILDDFSKIFSRKLNDSKTEALWSVFKVGHDQIQK